MRQLPRLQPAFIPDMSSGSAITRSNAGHSIAPSKACSGAACKHDVQFYSRDEFLLDSLAPFVANPLESGGGAVVVATKSHRDGLAHRLADCGIDLAVAVQEGRYLALDATETLATLMTGHSPDAVRFNEVIGSAITRVSAACRNRNSQMAIFGEMVNLLWQQGNSDAVIKLEQLWNELSRVYPFSLRCGYPLASFDRKEHREWFSQICGQHQSVIPAESYTSAESEAERWRLVAKWQQSEQALRTESLERLLAQNRNQQLIEQVRRQESAEEELRRFARRLLSTRDEEQRRIASELHENTAQLLAALSMYFGVLQEEQESLTPRAARVVANSRKVTENLLVEVRKLSYLLHPPTLDDVGLGSALREYVDHRADRSSMRVQLQISDTLGRLPRRIEIALFRMVEAVLSEISMHSHRGTAFVSLSRTPDKVLLNIHQSCDGAADAMTGTGSALTGMRERAVELGGSITIRTDHEGTLISVTLPADDPAERNTRSAA